ncbi:MAG: hypothetical protein R3C49_24445 [Planctomycetaceae bacterium]
MGSLPEGATPYDDVDVLFRFRGLKATPSLSYRLPAWSLDFINPPFGRTVSAACDRTAEN